MIITANAVIALNTQIRNAATISSQIDVIEGKVKIAVESIRQLGISTGNLRKLVARVNYRIYVASQHFDSIYYHVVKNRIEEIYTPLTGNELTLSNSIKGIILPLVGLENLFAEANLIQQYNAIASDVSSTLGIARSSFESMVEAFKENPNTQVAMPMSHVSGEIASDDARVVVSSTGHKYFLSVGGGGGSPSSSGFNFFMYS